MIKWEKLGKGSFKISTKNTISRENYKEFLEVVVNMTDDGAKLIIFDMNDINFLDMAGLRALYRISEFIKGTDSEMILIRPKENVINLIEITNLSESFEIMKAS